MSSVCITNCVLDTRVPPRATYTNLYKWPESDAEFVRSVRSNGRHVSASGAAQPPRLVDSVSCRQMYLRSYPFSRDDQVPDRSISCFGVGGSRKKRAERRRHSKRRCAGLRKVKEISWTALFSMFRRLLSYSASVDVVR